MKLKQMMVNDRMQQGYSYLLTKPTACCFHPEFSPDLTPKQMLALGVFGGKYMSDCREEFPASWFTKAKLSPMRADPAINYFKVAASKPLLYWTQMGWIHPRIPGDGFSGTVGTIWAGDQTTTNARSSGGRPCNVTWPNLRNIVARETLCAVPSRDRHFCIGHMTAGQCDRKTRPMDGHGV